jgi:predicted extracellular nuclease
MKLLLILILAVMLSATVFGQVVTTIADVQDTTGTGGSGDSKLKGQVVTVEGTVSGEAAAFGGKTFYIQDGTGPWSGVMVYDGAGRVNAYGDSIKITGTVTEYSGMTELTDITEYVKLDSGKTVEPSLVTTGEIASDSSNAEAY